MTKIMNCGQDSDLFDQKVDCVEIKKPGPNIQGSVTHHVVKDMYSCNG